MNYETDKQSVYHFTAFFLYRRLIFSIVLLTPLFVQLTVLSTFCMAMLLYLIRWSPMESGLYDFAAIFNEGVFWLCIYLMVLFNQGFVHDPALRYEIGGWFLYLLYMNFGLNLIMLAIESIRLLVLHFKRWSF